MTSRIVSSSATVTAPPAAIFEILADPRQHSRIDGSGTVRGVRTGPDRLTKGARFGMDMKRVAPYKITSEVVEFEEGRRIAWRHPGGHVWRYELEPAGAGTRVTESFDYSGVPGAQAKLYELLGVVRGNRRGIEKTLERLAEAAEQDAR